MHDDILGTATCFEESTAYFYNDVRMGHRNLQPSHLACQKSCSDHPECVYWTWTKKTPNNCYLKHTRGDASPGFSSYISGPKQGLLPEANSKYIQVSPFSISRENMASDQRRKKSYQASVYGFIWPGPLWLPVSMALCYFGLI